jgi:hypothetical protein
MAEPSAPGETPVTCLIRSSFTFTVSRLLFHFDQFTESRTLWTSDQLVARPLPKHRTTQTQNKHIHIPNIHALFGVRTHDPGFRACEDRTCLRPLGYRDRLTPATQRQNTRRQFFPRLRQQQMRHQTAPHPTVNIYESVKSEEPTREQWSVRDCNSVKCFVHHNKEESSLHLSIISQQPILSSRICDRRRPVNKVLLLNQS